MQSLARLIPQSWALLGLQEPIGTGGGLEAVALNIAVLAVYAAVLMALAAWRFRKAISGLIHGVPLPGDPAHALGPARRSFTPH